MKRSFSSADELDGFDELQPADQQKIRKAWEDGHVADEDIPETARKPDDGDDANEEEKPKKKRAPAKKDEVEEAKPKKARTSKKVIAIVPVVFKSRLLISSPFTRSPMKKVMPRMMLEKRKSPRKHPLPSLVQR